MGYLIVTVILFYYVNSGYENIESVRQVMSSTSSDLPRTAIHSINEEAEEEDDPHTHLTQSSTSSMRT